MDALGPPARPPCPSFSQGAEIVGLLQQGVGHLLREAGLTLMSLVMEEDVRHLAGERHQQHAERRVHRWGQRTSRQRHLQGPPFPRPASAWHSTGRERDRRS
ncbi:MAG: hypothetical protein QOE55_8303 [Acidobacteriaceae bacterium]|nr:hypothetical protein [Acidobacteriaceae bacterium]